MNAETLRKINSATKYPSILTYHRQDQANGLLGEERNHEWADVVVATEKIDGSNGRIIVWPAGRKRHDWLIGSREDLLTHEDDRVYNTSQGIVDALRPVADQVAACLAAEDRIVTAYFEVFGQRSTSQWKQYGDGKTTGVRLFDVSTVRLSTLDMTLEQIASWRDRGNQEWAPLAQLEADASFMEVQTVPFLFRAAPEALPVSLAETQEFLKNIVPTSRALLTPDALGVAEGMVLRTPDRRVIAKLRHADYEGTFRRMEAAEKKATKARLVGSKDGAA